MKKIIIILSLMTFAYASPVFSECPAWDTSGNCNSNSFDTTCGTIATTNEIMSNSNYVYSAGGLYDTQAEAAAACQAKIGYACGNKTKSYLNKIVGDTTYFNSHFYYKSTNLGGGFASNMREFFVFSEPAGTCLFVAPEYNPFPDSAIFRWKEVGRQYDSEGNVIGQLIQFSNPVTGETKTEYFGDLPSEHCTTGQIESGACPITLVLNDYWRPGSEFNDLYGNSDVGSSSPFPSPGHIDQQATVGGVDTDQTGVGDSGSTDTELLQNIATNTRFNTANQQILSSQLTELTNSVIEGNNMAGQIGASVAGGIGMSNSLLADIRDGIEGLETGGGGASAVDIGQAVGDELIESTEFTGQTGNEFDSILAEINAFRTELGIPENDDEYFPEGGINDEESFKLAVQDMLIDKTDTTWFQALRNLMMMDRITAAGSCSASVALWGGSIDLSVCGLQGALNVFGTVLLGFATITAFMVALRG